MSKQLTNLYNKALEKGFAKVNGRYYEYDFGYRYGGDLMEKWSITYIPIHKVTGSQHITLRHWETIILDINISAGIINDIHISSKSDRDGIECVLALTGFDWNYGVRYRPSQETGYLINKVLGTEKEV